MNSFTISLPWPPSANNYWRRNGGRYFISPNGIAFRKLTINACNLKETYFVKSCRLRLDVVAFPPDRRRRDLDNLGKCIMDSLQHAQVYEDDSQIDWLTFQRRPELLGKVNIVVSNLTEIITI